MKHDCSLSGLPLECTTPPAHDIAANAGQASLFTAKTTVLFSVPRDASSTTNSGLVPSRRSAASSLFVWCSRLSARGLLTCHTASAGPGPASEAACPSAPSSRAVATSPARGTAGAGTREPSASPRAPWPPSCSTNRPRRRWGSGGGGGGGGAGCLLSARAQSAREQSARAREALLQPIQRAHAARVQRCRAWIGTSNLRLLLERMRPGNLRRHNVSSE